MKQILKPILIIFLFIGIFYSRADATNFGVLLGLSTPNDQVNNVYNSNSITDVGKLFREGSKLGYHFGAKVRMEMSDNLYFVGGIAYHKFPETTIEVRHPITDSLLTTLKTSQNVVPITAGINFFIIKKFIGVYAVGDLTYNYLFSSVDYPKGDVDLPISTSPSDSRIGFGLGAGVDLDVQLVTLNLEVKYNYINLIGQAAGEEAKAFISLSLGAFF